MKLAVRIADREMPVDGLVLDIALGDVGIDASVQGFFIETRLARHVRDRTENSISPNPPSRGTEVLSQMLCLDV